MSKKKRPKKESKPKLEEKFQPAKSDERNNEEGKEGSSMQIAPLADRVLVRPLEAEEKTKGGIILPDTAKEKPQEGRVMAVGKGKVSDDGKFQPMEVKVGDKILYGKYSGTEIKIEDIEHLIIRQEDILAVIQD